MILFGNIKHVVNLNYFSYQLIMLLNLELGKHFHLLYW